MGARVTRFGSRLPRAKSEGGLGGSRIGPGRWRLGGSACARRGVAPCGRARPRETCPPANRGDRHWTELMKVTRRHFDKGPEFCFRHLLDLELHHFADDVTEIV